MLAFACAADAAFGDPAGFPHPVRAFGALCTIMERLVRAWARGDARRERIGGALLCATIVGGTYLLSSVVLARAKQTNARGGLALEIALAWTTLAARDLIGEARAVIAALDADDIASARRRIARIVGRDCARLDRAEIARATIETLAESACDGIVAPLLALAVGGVPLALAFKAASTLDSMIGHVEAPYTHIGMVAARVDDVACFIPARMTALAIALCAPLARGDAGRALSVLFSDGHLHRSPNAGRPEAAMAGALGVRLGGPNTYDGVEHFAPFLGARFPQPTVTGARKATTLVIACAGALALGLVAACGAIELQWKVR